MLPDEAALLRRRSKVQDTVQQAWCTLMKGTPDVKTTDGLFKKMQRTTVPISSTQKIPAIRFFLNAPQELIDIFVRRPDSSPFAGRMVFPGKTYFVNLFRRARPSLVREIAHPGDDDVDPEHIAFLLRYKLFAYDGGVPVLIQTHLRAQSLPAPTLPFGISILLRAACARA